MSLTTRIAAVTVVGLMATAAVAPPAGAITDGQPDGNLHPNVGMLLFYSEGGRFRCSGTLISPTVVVTAAHCTDATDGRTLVTFDTTIAATAPSEVPAADPAVGFTTSGTFVDARGRTWRAGTAHTHPQYSNFTDLANWNDTGVVVLDEAVTEVALARLAPADFLLGYQQPTLNKTNFEVVGYGTRVAKPEVAGPQKPIPLSFPLIRRYTTSPGQKLSAQILQLNGNGNDVRGGGGTCFGDSGGPVFVGGFLVADTSYGYTANCRYLGGYQRLDIPVVRDWVLSFA